MNTIQVHPANPVSQPAGITISPFFIFVALLAMALIVSARKAGKAHANDGGHSRRATDRLHFRKA